MQVQAFLLRCAELGSFRCEQVRAGRGPGRPCAGAPRHSCNFALHSVVIRRRYRLDPRPAD